MSDSPDSQPTQPLLTAKSPWANDPINKPTGRSEPVLSDSEIRQIVDAETIFDEMCRARHDRGRDKYGKLTFLDMPTLTMALEELADVANYIRYTFVKLYLLRESIRQHQQKAIGSTEGFFPTQEVLGLKKDM